MYDRYHTEARKKRIQEAIELSKPRAGVVEVISPTEQVLRQFRMFATPEPELTGVGEPQNDVLRKTQASQRSAESTLDSVEEKSLERSINKMLPEIQVTGRDWSKPVTKPPRRRHGTGFRTGQPGASNWDLAPNNHYRVVDLSPVPAQASFWESLSLIEYICYFGVILFVSVCLFYPGGLDSFKEYLTSSLNRVIPGVEESSKEQITTGNQFSQPVTNKPQAIPRKKGKRGAPAGGAGQRAEPSRLSEDAMPPAVDESLKERLKESPTPVEYVKRSTDRREMPPNVNVLPPPYCRGDKNFTGHY